MPVSQYFQGKGRKVLRDMKERYGEEKGERVFYATASKQKQKSEGRHKKALDGLKKARS